VTKNSATFGLSALDRKPCRRYADRRADAAGAAGATGTRRERAADQSICAASHSRYTAPTIFNTVNAVAEASSSADSPSAAAPACTVSPRTPPSIVNTPPYRPPTRALRVIRAWSGPGSMISTRAAIANVVMDLTMPPHDR
jgi:hypothetical protein